VLGKEVVVANLPHCPLELLPGLSLDLDALGPLPATRGNAGMGEWRNISMSDGLVIEEDEALFEKARQRLSHPLPRCTIDADGVPARMNLTCLGPCPCWDQSCC
jgi:hypothetical protein